MEYGVLWLESLAAALLLIAAAVAWRAQSARRWLTFLALLAALGVPLLVGVAECGVVLYLRHVSISQAWLAYTCAWLVALLVGMVLILKIGLAAAGVPPRAAQWPLARLAFACAAALALHCMTLWNVDSAICQRLAALRLEASAIALSIAPSRPSDRENAALIYEKVFEESKRIAKPFRRAGSLNKLFGNFLFEDEIPRDDPALAEYLRQCQPLIAELKRAAALPSCSFDIDYFGSNLMTIELPELACSRQCARILAADALEKAARGETRAALENVAAIDGMSAHIAAEPCLISGLFALALNALQTRALEDVLASNTPNAGELAAFPVESALNLKRVLTRGMIGEEALGLSAFTLLEDSQEFKRAGGFGDDTYLWPALFFYRVYLLEEELENYKTFMLEMRKISQLNFSKALAEIKTREANFQGKPRGIFSGMVTPVLGHSVETFARAQAQQSLSALAIAVAKFRAKNGRLPARQAELVPEFIAEIPLDPFDAQPLRFKATPDSVILYSIGVDLTDDGGVSVDRKINYGRTGDIVFKIPAKPQPPK